MGLRHRIAWAGRGGGGLQRVDQGFLGISAVIAARIDRAIHAIAFELAVDLGVEQESFCLFALNIRVEPQVR